MGVNGTRHSLLSSEALAKGDGDGGESNLVYTLKKGFGGQVSGNKENMGFGDQEGSGFPDTRPLTPGTRSYPGP